MTSVNIKRVMSESIACALSAGVIGLSGKVSAVQEGPESVQDYPSVALLSQSFEFLPTDPDEVYWNTNTDDGQTVFNIGEFEGSVTLQLYAKNKTERELYEQRILDLFLATPGAPGTLFVDTPTLIINSYTSLYSAQIKARLESAEWREEFSFESKRFSFLDIQVSYPALTARAAITAVSIQIAQNGDLSSDTPVDSAAIQDDGSTVLIPV